ncbi:MAG: DALR domain-containing protein, partial [Eubacteriales bacterium]
HCGGIDNAFPHHTNEIAQSEAYLGHKWCPQWFHVLHLNTNDGKMSKSKGEFLTVSLLEEKGYDPLVYRFFCLQSHYRKALVFSWEGLDNARVSYDRLTDRIAALKPGGTVCEENCARYTAAFAEAMDNDLNTATAITTLYDVVKAKIPDADKLWLLGRFDTVLSLGLLEAGAKKREAIERAKAEEEARAAAEKEEAMRDPFTASVYAAIEERAAAKKAKNFARADEIRNELLAKGVTLIDTPQGTTFRIEQ